MFGRMLGKVASFLSSGSSSSGSRCMLDLKGASRYYSASTYVCGDSMKDEYHEMDSSGLTFHAGDYKLESGVVLPNVEVRYNTYGKLNEAKDNVLVVCHALTGNSALDKWWGNMLGSGRAFDTDKYLIIAANALGSCYGTTGPRSINPSTNKMYMNDFPAVTIRDSVSLHMKLVKEGIGVSKVYGVVGGSLGGMQALEWALIGGAEFVPRLVAIGCGATHTAWQIAISEAQRQSIYFDEKWRDGNVDPEDPPLKGLNVARQMAMTLYRTSRGYEVKFGRTRDQEGNFEVKNYLEYQGRKFMERFDPVTYVHLTRLMDTHDVGRDRGGLDAALAGYAGRALVMGMDTDVLYPLYMQKELAARLPNSTFEVISSNEGHDGFLLEQEIVGNHLKRFLKE